MLIAAPADSAIVQNDCDCACPAVPASAVSARPLHEHTRLRLHPQSRFMELKIEHVELRSVGETFEYLLFIPSVLSGVVVSRELRDRLLAICLPASLAELRAGMPQELIERC